LKRRVWPGLTLLSGTAAQPRSPDVYFEAFQSRPLPSLHRASTLLCQDQSRDNYCPSCGVFDLLNHKRSVSLTHQRLLRYSRLGRSLLAERYDRVNPGSSQRWDQACEYGNHR
jgi:hypothetical protein